MIKMNIDVNKSKISTIALILLLTISVTIVALPSANAQPTLVMNCGTQAILTYNFDVDLNGPSSQLTGLKFAYKAPGATDWVLTTEPIIDNEPGLPGERYVTDAGGDCDIDVLFSDFGNQLGDWEVKWVHPETGAESDVVTVTVVDKIARMTYAFIGAMPNPVGVNQEVLLHIGIPAYLTGPSDGWENLTVTVTDPTEHQTTLGPYRTDATGGTGGVFIPTMVGIYKLQTHFPEQIRPGGTTMEASDSDILDLVVLSEPIAEYPGHKLPEFYWSRPIDGQLREWYQVAGNWPITLPFESGWSAYAPYNDGPETAHVLWAQPHGLGGLVGGDSGEQAIGDGDAYEGLYVWPTILNGRLYYNDVLGAGSTRTEQNVVCIDIHTGEQLWKRPLVTPDGDEVRLDFGQNFYWDSYNYHGVHSYLWADEGSTWYAFDPFNGRWLYTMENVPANAGPSYLGGLADNTRIGPKGEIYAYVLNTRAGTLSLWNSSSVVSDAGSWRPTGNTYTCTEDSARNGGWEYEVSIPLGLSGSAEEYIFNDRVIGTNETDRISYVDAGINMWAISLKPGEEGKLLFDEVWQPPTGNIGVMYGKASAEDRVFTFWGRETRTLWGFDLDSGKEIWGPSETMHYMTIYTIEQHFAYNKLIITPRVVGDCYALNPRTGQTLWKYQVVDPLNEYLFNTLWGVRVQFIADGKVYLGHDEHSPVDPKPRGAPYVCLDINDGSVIWRADGLIRQADWGGRSAIADSIIVSQDTYSQEVYGVGKGPSAITVENPVAAVNLGKSITIQGTMMDVSPGTEDTDMKLRFPNGVPAISDEDMSEWMLHVYKQFERPDVTGVTVKLEAVDPNNTYKYLGTTTSDAYGNYGFSFKPESEGTYMILATFEGSKAFYGSTSTTYLTVDPAAAAGDGTDLTSLENSVSDVEASVSNVTTYLLAILAVVIIALLVAVYSLLKSRQ